MDDRRLKNTYWRPSQSRDWHFQMPVTVWRVYIQQDRFKVTHSFCVGVTKKRTCCHALMLLIETHTHARRREGDLHSWRLSCQVDRPPATTEEMFIVHLFVWLLPFRGFTMEIKHKAKSTGNFPMLKSVRVHHWQQIWALKASLELGFSFKMHIDFWHCWVRHISTLTRQLTLKHMHTHTCTSIFVRALTNIMHSPFPKPNFPKPPLFTLTSKPSLNPSPVFSQSAVTAYLNIHF